MEGHLLRTVDGKSCEFRKLSVQSLPKMTGRAKKDFIDLGVPFPNNFAARDETGNNSKINMKLSTKGYWVWHRIFNSVIFYDRISVVKFCLKQNVQKKI